MYVTQCFQTIIAVSQIFFNNTYDNFHIQWQIPTKQGSTECELMMMMISKWHDQHPNLT
jgi:hypothetical protein